MGSVKMSYDDIEIDFFVFQVYYRLGKSKEKHKPLLIKTLVPEIPYAHLLLLVAEELERRVNGIKITSVINLGVFEELGFHDYLVDTLSKKPRSELFDDIPFWTLVLETELRSVLFFIQNLFPLFH